MQYISTKIAPINSEAIQKKAEKLYSLFEVKPEDEDIMNQKKDKEKTLFISSAFVKQKSKRRNEFDVRQYLQDDSPIQINSKFDMKLIHGQKYRQDKIRQSLQMSFTDESKNLFNPRTQYRPPIQIQSTHSSIAKNNINSSLDNPPMRPRMQTEVDRHKLQSINLQKHEELEEQRLNDLPGSIEEIEKIKEENIMIQYKGGRQMKGREQDEKKSYDNAHQRQISCFQEFNNLDIEEKMKSLLHDDQLQYISFNPTYDEKINPKNIIQPLLDFSALSRDLLIQPNQIKKSLVQSCVDILRLDDILINRENIQLNDITNIVSERINQNQLKYLFTTQGILDLANQVQIDPSHLAKKKASKLDPSQKIIPYEQIDLISEIKDLKKVDLIKQQKFDLSLAGYNDQSCQVNQFQIVEETKLEIDWALEDFYFIKSAKQNVDSFPTFFDGVQQLQTSMNKRFEDSLIELLRIFLEVPKDDYYVHKKVTYQDLMGRLKQIIKNPESLKDQYVQGQKKIKILYVILNDFLIIIEKEEKLIEQIKLIHQTLTTQKEEKEKEQSKPAYIRDYENGTIKSRKANQNKIFSVINTFKSEKKVKPFKF